MCGSDDHGSICCVRGVWSVSLMRVKFCFFKQKTAYEMRITDWSSDVCSSDLIRTRPLCNVFLESLDYDEIGHEEPGQIFGNRRLCHALAPLALPAKRRI